MCQNASWSSQRDGFFLCSSKDGDCWWRGYKKEDAVLKTGDRQAEDLCKVKQVQIRWKGCEEFSNFEWEVRSHHAVMKLARHQVPVPSQLHH